MSINSFLYEVRKYQNIDAEEEKDIHQFYSNLQSFVGRSITNPDVAFEMIRHAEHVAERIAKWSLDLEWIKVALLHDVILERVSTKEDRERLTHVLNEKSMEKLNEFKEVHDQIKQLEKSHIDSDTIVAQFEYHESKAFYIKIAERMSYLSGEVKAINRVKKNDEIFRVAERTRHVLIPLVRSIGAITLSGELEELCFIIENKKAYSAIRKVLEELKVSCAYSQKEFLNLLEWQFDPKRESEIESLNRARQYVSQFIYERRSFWSLHRYAANGNVTDSSKGYDIDKISNYTRTAYYDLTLIVKDSVKESQFQSPIDVFLEYYRYALEEQGARLHGFFQTATQDSYFFLLSDAQKNKYRLFVRTEHDFRVHRYGGILAGESYVHKYSPEERMVMVYKKNGDIAYFPMGATVLDLAFSVHRDVGLGFHYAKINDNSHPYPEYTELPDKSKVEIMYEDYARAELSWFRHVKTDDAFDMLISYFKTGEGRKQVNAKKRITINTKDGTEMIIPQGATVLDCAFRIHEDMGLHYSKASINGKNAHMSQVVHNNDTVIIESDEEVWPEYAWIRYVNTKKAIDILIRYFECRDRRKMVEHS